MKNIFISIDPGLYSFGYAIFSSPLDNSDLFFLSSGTITFSSRETLPNKLSQLYEFFYNLIHEKYLSRSDFTVFIICENQFIKHNQRDIFTLVACKSIFILLSGQLNCAFFQMSPCEVKKIITGSGAAEKSDVLRCLQILYPGFSPSSLDESDAAALALAAWRKSLVGSK